MVKRINITIDEDLLNKIDSYAKKKHCSRSGLISYVFSTYFEFVEKSLGSYALKHSTGCSEV